MTQPAQPEYRMVRLTRGQFALIDFEDVERINCHCWSASWNSFAHDYHPVRSEYMNGKRITIIMAREVMNAPDGMQVDHVNGDPKDNRKENLRLVTHMQNSWNRKGRSDSGQLYKGVVLLQGKWYAGIGVNWKQIRSGPFETPEEARDEYARLSIEYHRGFGCVTNERRVSEVLYAPVLERAAKKKTGKPLRPRMAQPDDESVRYIPLTFNQFTIVDADRYEEFSAHNWSAIWSVFTKSYYAVRTAIVDGKKVHVRMHRLIMDAPGGMVVDHVNHLTLDNRRCNLRLATRSQNMGNRRPQKNLSCGLKGVTFGAGKWMACIGINGKRRTIGRFATAEEAHQAYRKVALEVFGEFACLE